MKRVTACVVGAWLFILTAVGADGADHGSGYVPVRLSAGTNAIPNIAGDGVAGSITLYWRENGNAWGYDVFTVVAGPSIATVEGEDHFHDRPFDGEYGVKAVRFARKKFGDRTTTFALIATRSFAEGIPQLSQTTIEIFALVRNDEGLGTPYHFVRQSKRVAGRRYCNAEMALKTELGLPLSKSYGGAKTTDGC